MSYSFSSYFFSNKYSKFRSEHLHKFEQAFPYHAYACHVMGVLVLGGYTMGSPPAPHVQEGGSAYRVPFMTSAPNAPDIHVVV